MEPTWLPGRSNALSPLARLPVAGIAFTGTCCYLLLLVMVCLPYPRPCDGWGPGLQPEPTLLPVLFPGRATQPRVARASGERRSYRLLGLATLVSPVFLFHTGWVLHNKRFDV